MKLTKRKLYRINCILTDELSSQFGAKPTIFLIIFLINFSTIYIEIYSNINFIKHSLRNQK